MKKQQNILVHMHALMLLLGSIGFSSKAYTQSVAEQCRKASFDSTVIGCSADRPCILRLRQNGQTLQVGWDGQKDYDAYNFRWSTRGKMKAQVELQGGPGGIYEINDLKPCATYSLKIQGCNKAAGPRCTAWASALFTMEPNLPEGPETCQKIYVWRDAYPGDHVCVTPRERDQAAKDNEQASSRRDPHGESGSDSCLPGYVWREAREEDHVCVAPKTRLQVQSDNHAKCKRLASCRSGIQTGL
jgi:hypothetical protein